MSFQLTVIHEDETRPPLETTVDQSWIIGKECPNEDIPISDVIMITNKEDALVHSYWMLFMNNEDFKLFNTFLFQKDHITNMLTTIQENSSSKSEIYKRLTLFYFHQVVMSAPQVVADIVIDMLPISYLLWNNESGHCILDTYITRHEISYDPCPVHILDYINKTTAISILKVQNMFCLMADPKYVLKIIDKAHVDQMELLMILLEGTSELATAKFLKLIRITELNNAIHQNSGIFIGAVSRTHQNGQTILRHLIPTAWFRELTNHDPRIVGKLISKVMNDSSVATLVDNGYNVDLHYAGYVIRHVSLSYDDNITMADLEHLYKEYNDPLAKIIINQIKETIAFLKIKNAQIDNCNDEEYFLEGLMSKSISLVEELNLMQYVNQYIIRVNFIDSLNNGMFNAAYYLFDILNEDAREEVVKKFASVLMNKVVSESDLDEKFRTKFTDTLRELIQKYPHIVITESLLITAFNDLFCAQLIIYNVSNDDYNTLGVIWNILKGDSNGHINFDEQIYQIIGEKFGYDKLMYWNQFEDPLVCFYLRTQNIIGLNILLKLCPDQFNAKVLFIPPKDSVVPILYHLFKSDLIAQEMNYHRIEQVLRIMVNELGIKWEGWSKVPIGFQRDIIHNFRNPEVVKIFYKLNLINIYSLNSSSDFNINTIVYSLFHIPFLNKVLKSPDFRPDMLEVVDISTGDNIMTFMAGNNLLGTLEFLVDNGHISESIYNYVNPQSGANFLHILLTRHTSELEVEKFAKLINSPLLSKESYLRQRKDGYNIIHCWLINAHNTTPESYSQMWYIIKSHIFFDEKMYYDMAYDGNAYFTVPMMISNEDLPMNWNNNDLFHNYIRGVEDGQISIATLNYVTPNKESIISYIHEEYMEWIYTIPGFDRKLLLLTDANGIIPLVDFAPWSIYTLKIFLLDPEFSVDNITKLQSKLSCPVIYQQLAFDPFGVINLILEHTELDDNVLMHPEYGPIWYLASNIEWLYDIFPDSEMFDVRYAGHNIISFALQCHCDNFDKVCNLPCMNPYMFIEPLSSRLGCSILTSISDGLHDEFIDYVFNSRHFDSFLFFNRNNDGKFSLVSQEHAMSSKFIERLQNYPEDMSLLFQEGLMIRIQPADIHLLRKEYIKPKYFLNLDEHGRNYIHRYPSIDTIQTLKNFLPSKKVDKMVMMGDCHNNNVLMMTDKLYIQINIMNYYPDLEFQTNKAGNNFLHFNIQRSNDMMFTLGMFSDKYTSKTYRHQNRLGMSVIHCIQTNVVENKIIKLIDNVDKVDYTVLSLSMRNGYDGWMYLVDHYPRAFIRAYNKHNGKKNNVLARADKQGVSILMRLLKNNIRFPRKNITHKMMMMTDCSGKPTLDYALTNIRMLRWLIESPMFHQDWAYGWMTSDDYSIIYSAALLEDSTSLSYLINSPILSTSVFSSCTRKNSNHIVHFVATNNPSKLPILFSSSSLTFNSVIDILRIKFSWVINVINNHPDIFNQLLATPHFSYKIVLNNDVIDALVAQPRCFTAWISSDKFSDDILKIIIFNTTMVEIRVLDIIMKALDINDWDMIVKYMKSMSRPNPPATEDSACTICYANLPIVTFNCNHILCIPCSMRVSICPICRTKIKDRIVDGDGYS